MGVPEVLLSSRTRFGQDIKAGALVVSCRDRGGELCLRLCAGGSASPVHPLCRAWEQAGQARQGCSRWRAGDRKGKSCPSHMDSNDFTPGNYLPRAAPRLLLRGWALGFPESLQPPPQVGAEPSRCQPGHPLPWGWI